MIPLCENCLTVPPRIDQKRKQQGIVQHKEFCNIPRNQPHMENSIMPSS